MANTVTIGILLGLAAVILAIGLLSLAKLIQDKDPSPVRGTTHGWTRPSAGRGYGVTAPQKAYVRTGDGESEVASTTAEEDWNRPPVRREFKRGRDEEQGWAGSQRGGDRNEYRSPRGRYDGGRGHRQYSSNAPNANYRPPANNNPYYGEEPPLAPPQQVYLPSENDVGSGAGTPIGTMKQEKVPL